MKVFLFRGLFVLLVQISVPTTGYHDLKKAFVNISEALSKQNHLLTIVLGPSQSDKVDSAALESTADVPHIVVGYDDKSNEIRVGSSAIVQLDSVASLDRLNSRIYLRVTLSTKNQIFILCRDGTFDKIAKIKNKSRFSNPIILYEYFVVEEDASIRILTFVWYTPEKCGAQLVEVNRFDKKVARWQHGNFKIDKFSNFHGCRINFLMRVYVPEFLPKSIDFDGLEVPDCDGYNCAVIKDFSSVLNYRYHLNLFFRDDKMWRNIPHDLLVQSQPLNTKYTMQQKSYFHATRPIYYMEHFLAVPPGEEYDGYEKLVLPFDEEIWIGITFAAAFVTIFVLRFVPVGISNFVIGKRIETPALNVLAAFFGISQITCPGRNFARYLLMVFILFSLIIRTAYQGKMFEFLQKEMRKPTVTTIEEMIDQNFTIVLVGNSKDLCKDLELFNRGNFVDNSTNEEFTDALYRSYIAGSKTSIIYKKDMYLAFVRFRLGRTDPPKVLKERFMLEARALIFDPFHFLFDIFDQKLQQYIEGGFINYNTRNFDQEHNPKKYEDYQEPFAILTFGELEAGFVACLVPFVLSILVFFIEWIPTMKNLIIFRFVFKKYFEVKHSGQKNHGELMRVKLNA